MVEPPSRTEWHPAVLGHNGSLRDSIAGYVNLGKGGKIVGGESLRDSFAVYSEDSISMLDYVGDALGWRREPYQPQPT